jgi:hypothetical protein
MPGGCLATPAPYLDLHPGVNLMPFCSRNVLAALVLLLATTLGCGSSGPARSPVKGTVKTIDGKAVDQGALTFAPVVTDASAPSPPVSAQIKPDGTFEVDGGAVVGKHTVSFEPAYVPYEAEWDGTGTPPEAPPQPFAGLVPKTKEVDFTTEENVLSVELVPANSFQ